MEQGPAFRGKVALITGASSGIGRASAVAFARAGAAVMIGDVQTEGAAETIRIIESAGGNAGFVRCDVATAADVKNLIDRTVAAHGRLDYAFNNAGIEGQQATTPECTEENWDRVVAINLKGVWLCMKYEIPEILRQGGAIVNCSSVAGLVGFLGIPAYVAAKHGVVGLTRAAALEHAKTGLRVNAVCPGVIQTPMIDRFVHGEAQARRQLIEGEPVGRVGTPEEVAQAVVWLCSDAASFVTGVAMPVDGGWVAQ